MRDHNPNDAFRAKLEDPLTLMRAREALSEGSRKFELKTPMTTSGLSPTRGGVDPGAANQQLLYDIDGEEAMEELELESPSLTTTTVDVEEYSSAPPRDPPPKL